MPTTDSLTIDAQRPLPLTRPTRRRFIVMGFLCGLSFLTYFDRVCMMRAKGEIKLDLGLSDGQFGFILGAFWLAYGLFEIPSGWIGDRFGARKGLSRIVLAWSLFTALSGTATGFISLLSYRFFFGVGEAGAYPNMAKIQSAWLPIKSRARAGGALWLAARWGAAFSPFIFGSMLRWADSPDFRSKLSRVPLLHHASDLASWRIAFFFAGLLGVLWVVFFYPWFKDEPSQNKGVNQAELDLIQAGRVEKQTGAGHAMPRSGWKALFSSPSLWGLALLYLFGSFGYSFFMSYISDYYQAVLGVKYANSELMSGAPMFFAGLSCLAGGWLSDIVVRKTGYRRLGRAIFPLIGCGTAAVAVFSLQYAQTPMQATILLCIVAAAYDFGQGANWATIVDVGGSYAGSAAGFINMIGNMGQFLQPVLGPWIIYKYGFNSLFIIFACAYLVAGAMWLVINPNKTFYENKVVSPA